MNGDDAINRVRLKVFPSILLMCWVTFLGGCAQQVVNRKAETVIEVRIALILHPLTQELLPQKLKGSLVKAGIEVEPGDGMVYSLEGSVMSMYEDGVDITSVVEGQWGKIISQVKAKGLEGNLLELELMNGGFGLKKGELYIK